MNGMRYIITNVHMQRVERELRAKYEDSRRLSFVREHQF